MDKGIVKLIETIGGNEAAMKVLEKHIARRKVVLKRRTAKKILLAEFKAWKASQAS